MDALNQMIVAPARKPAVVLRRELVKVQAVMDALDLVEKAVFLASTAKTVAEYAPAELAAELNNTLRWIAKDIGVRITEESDMQYLVIRVSEILKRYYSALTLKDFRLAFEMLITGELDAFLPRGRDGQPDRNHYQQFNAEYICKILNAYKGRRGWVMNKAFGNVPRMEQKCTPEEVRYYHNSTRKECIEAFYHFKYRGRLPEMSPIREMLNYETLASVGLADEIEITLAEQKAILQLTIGKYAKQGNIFDVNRLKVAGTTAPELENGAFVLARRKALERSFRWMVDNEVQITDYIQLTNGD